jgi:hypothetical protein
VDADVTGMLRIALKCAPVLGSIQAVCGNGPTTERPL